MSDVIERYEIRETKEYSFEVYDHLDRGKKIATFLYFKDAARFCGKTHAVPAVPVPRHGRD